MGINLETGITYHACHTPYIGASAPFGSQNDFGRAILSSLNIIGEVMANPARITQVGDLDGDNVAFRFIASHGRILVE